MKFVMRAGGAQLAMALALAMPAQALAQDKAEKPASLHVQCDGAPNNVSSGETAARLLGAVTLLGLFAPPPEEPDASKRKFGHDGVLICSQLIDGDGKETNAARRANLILGRAIHRIEAKDYEGAIADAALARSEAEAAGLMADPYFTRSRARSFDLIEAAALYRLGKTAEARDVATRNLAPARHSFMTVSGVPSYLLNVRTESSLEAEALEWRARLATPIADVRADRLEEWGQFAKAAEVREALVDYNRRTAPDSRSTAWIAKSAIALGLAGNADLAAQRIAEAKANADKRKADGKPEADASEIVELLDLYAILKQAQAGELPAARRLFAARSQWVAASFGSVVEITRRLRVGATADELIGGLSHDPDSLWKDRIDTRRAEVLAKDDDNKTLFALIRYPAAASSYESLSKLVWRADKSKLLMPRQNPDAKVEVLYTYNYVGFDVLLQAYMLHAALLAKSRGHQGFTMTPFVRDNMVAGTFITGNLGDPGLQAPVFNEADDVIADLSQLIPSPETLKERRKKAR